MKLFPQSLKIGTFAKRNKVAAVPEMGVVATKAITMTSEAIPVASDTIAAVRPSSAVLQAPTEELAVAALPAACLKPRRGSQKTFFGKFKKTTKAIDQGLEKLKAFVRKVTGAADREAYAKLAQFCLDFEIVTYGPSEKPEETFVTICRVLGSITGHVVGSILEAMEALQSIFRRSSKN